jgi:DNA processing protein
MLPPALPLAAHPAASFVLSAEDELHWLALKMMPGLGSRKAVQLLQQFRSPKSIFRATVAELEGQGLSGSLAQSIASGCSFDEAIDQQARMKSLGVSLICFQDPLYPLRLKEIYDPPPVFFARGRLELLHSVMLGVVGTRRPTAYGILAAERLASDLALAHLTIISGMARGIDTAAHKAVLTVGGNTVAVLGCGVDVVYPAENRKLAGQIIEKGLLLSEFPMGAPPYPQNFPVRNRIIAGMAAGVLVVEGAQYSGSSITAKLAMEQGREVFAVPGNITNKMSWGPNLLIKEGAKLVQDWNDVVAELTPEDRRALVRERARSVGQGTLELETESARENPEIPQPELNRTLLAALKPDEPIHLDALIETFEYHSSSELIAALFDLEMLGLIRQMPGKMFVKVW